MGYIKSVNGAISSAIYIFLSIIFSLLLVNGYSLPVLASAFLSCVFIAMVIEDYIHLEIDIRLIIVLAIASMAATNRSLNEYLFYLFFGLIYYRIVYLTLIRYLDDMSLSAQDISKSVAQTGMGFLPSLASGLAIYAFFLYEFTDNLPVLITDLRQNCTDLYYFSVEEPLIAFLGILPFIIVWAFYEFKLYRAVKKQKPLRIMLGDGDVYVMAIWMGLLGTADMTIVLVISIIIQILAFVYKYITDNFYMGGNH